MSEETPRPRKKIGRRAAVALTGGVLAGGVIATGAMLGTGHGDSPAKSVSAGTSVLGKGAAAGAAAGGGVTVTTHGTVTEVASVMAGYQCKQSDRYHSYHSKFGAKLVEWHAVIKFCYNGKKVKLIRAGAYPKNVADNIGIDPATIRKVWNKKHSRVTVLISSKIENTNPWGWSGYRYPRTQFQASANGALSVKQWGGE